MLKSAGPQMAIPGFGRAALGRIVGLRIGDATIPVETVPGPRIREMLLAEDHWAAMFPALPLR
jgi:hypothetical protein